MDLMFQTQALQWLRCVLRQVRRQEETAEVAVPENWPEIGSVLDVHARAMLRGKDLRSGSITVHGSISGTVVYDPEDGSGPRCLHCDIPVSLRMESPELTEQSGILCDLRIASVDGRKIHGRKALLRVEISCSAAGYCAAEQNLTSLLQHPDQLQVKKTVYEPLLPLEIAERAFSVSDSLEFPAGSPPMEELLHLQCGLEITDRKVVGARAVFRGTATCRPVYLTENGEVCVQEFVLPFSQYCDLKYDYDDDQQPEFVSVITGCEAEPDGTGKKLYLQMQVLVQCLLRGRKRLELMEDAYAAGGMLQPVWEEFPMESVLDCPRTRQTLRIRLPEAIRHTVGTAVYLGHPNPERMADSMRITAPVSVRLLGYDRSGKLCAASGTGSAVWELPLSEQAQCFADGLLAEEPYISAAADGTEVRLDLELSALCTASQTMRTLAGGTLEPAVRSSGAPSVILRRAKRGEELWQIARAAGAGAQLLKQANGLEGDLVPDDRILLIPIG